MRVDRLLPGDRKGPLNVSVPWLALCLFFISCAFSYALTSIVSIKLFAMAMMLAVGLILLFKLSMTDLSWSVIVWTFSMFGLRSLAMVGMPGMPDLSFDRFFFIWIVMIFFFQLLLRRQRFRAPYAAELLLAVHTLYILMQLTVTGSIHVHAWTVSSLPPLFAFMCGKYLFQDGKAIRNLLIFFLLLLGYYSFTSIVEHFKIEALVFPKQILNPEWGQLWQPGRSRGPIMHPPLNGQLMAMMLMIHFFFMAGRSKMIGKVLLWVSLAAGGLGVFFAYTRGPWLAAAVALALLFALRPGYRKVLAVIALVCALGGAFGVFQAADSEFLQERMSTTNTVSNRLIFLATAFRMIQDQPLFGVGYFRFTVVRDDYLAGVNVPFYGYVPYRFGEGMSIHDIYVGRMADEGLISIVLLALFSYVFIKVFIRHWRADPQDKWFNRDFLAMSAAIMVCYHVGGMVIDYRYFDNINVMYMLFAGIIYGYQPERYARPPAVNDSVASALPRR